MMYDVFELYRVFARFPRCNSGKLKNIDGFSNFYSVYYVLEL